MEPDFFSFPKLHQSELRLISDFVETEFGIKTPPSKRILIQGRLAKRLRACGVHSYAEYFSFISGKDLEGRNEFLHFTDLVSTHETSFFREDRHFSYLGDTFIPKFSSDLSHREINILSAACSSGEEAYTLAMILKESLEKTNRLDMSINIDGVDLSQRMVDIAARGVYTEEKVSRIPPLLKVKYLMRSRDLHNRIFRFVPEIRALMSFRTGNLLTSLSLPRKHYDIIFCRNVLIYFARENQIKVLLSLLPFLEAGGLLFLGHSESISGLDLPIRAVTSAVYRRA